MVERNPRCVAINAQARLIDNFDLKQTQYRLIAGTILQRRKELYIALCREHDHQ